MRFRRGARLETGDVAERRGAGMSFGPGVALGGGGGIVGLVVAPVLVFSGLNGGGTNGFDFGGSDNADLARTCRTGAYANQHEDCRIVAVVNSVQDYWSEALDGYGRTPTVFFTGRTQTGCGPATSA